MAPSIHFITGATGFLGRYLALHLVKNFPEAEVHTCGRGPLSIPGTTHHVIDLASPELAQALINQLRPDYVYHLAGISRVSGEITVDQYFKSNTLTSQILATSLAQTAKPVKFFLGSSVHVYGNREERVSEIEAVHPQSPYAFSKFLAEETLFDLSYKNPNLNVVIGRLYSCFGPGQRPGFVTSDLCTKIRALPLDGKGTLQVGALDAYRSFIDVRDAVQLLPRLLEAKLASRCEIFNLASPHEHTIQEVLDTLLKISGRQAQIKSSGAGSNSFKGLRVSVKKLETVLPGVPFRPIAQTLGDMWQSAG